MTGKELIRRHPRLWHMAADGMWPSIQKRGLLSVSALLDLYGIEGNSRLPIEAGRRPQCVTISHPQHGDAVIRDNKPLFESSLLKCLRDGMTPTDWYKTLNAKSFFWVERERLERLLGAQAYAKDPQTVIEIDTEKLVERHRNRVRLCAINSGQTLYVPQPRGRDTFKKIEEFPDAGGRIGTKKRPKIVELVVEEGVPDLKDMVIRVDRVFQGDWEQLWP